MKIEQSLGLVRVGQRFGTGLPGRRIEKRSRSMGWVCPRNSSRTFTRSDAVATLWIFPFMPWKRTMGNLNLVAHRHCRCDGDQFVFTTVCCFTWLIRETTNFSGTSGVSVPKSDQPADSLAKFHCALHFHEVELWRGDSRETAVLATRSCPFGLPFGI